MKVTFQRRMEHGNCRVFSPVPPWCRFHCCSCLEHGSAFLGTRQIGRITCMYLHVYCGYNCLLSGKAPREIVKSRCFGLLFSSLWTPSWKTRSWRILLLKVWVPCAYMILAGTPPHPPNVMYPSWPPSPPPPCGCGLWLFLWVGNVALVLALPHNDRCGVIRGSQRRGTWMGQTKWSS